MRPNPLHILHKPYPLFGDVKQNLPYLLGLALFVAGFLIVLQPLGLSSLQWKYKNLALLGFGGVTFAVLALNCSLTPRVMPRFFNPDVWNVGREVGWQLWNWFTAVVILAVYWATVVGMRFTPGYLFRFTLNGLLVATFLAPICVLLNYSRLLKRKVRQAQTLDLKLREIPRSPADERIELESETGGETLRVPAGRLLFIRSRDNYAEVVWQKNGQLKSHLIRSSLKRLAQQIEAPFVVHCHRSFIVNLRNVHAVRGNASELTLHLESCDEPIPVSRESVKEVLRALENLSPARVARRKASV